MVPNIVVRLLMYLAETWQAYINKDTQNPYSSKKLELPDPEFYVIYTGKKSGYGETISLAEEFLESDKFLDLKATIIYGWEDGIRIIFRNGLKAQGTGKFDNIP